jgi:creatinine amidohydrolase
MPVTWEEAHQMARESLLRLSEMTWTEVEALDRARVVAILPLGAVEAHGPHLPLATDGIIAGAMADEAARRLAVRGWMTVQLPAIDYSAAPFAAGFPGTVSLRPETTTALIEDIGSTVAGWEVPVLVVLAEQPQLVRREVSSRLEPNPASLSKAIAEGRRSFAEAGGPLAYFGDPAAAGADEGRATITELGAILEEAVLAELDAGSPGKADQGRPAR